MDIFSLFNLLALAYAVIAVQVVRRLVAGRRQTFDADVTAADRRLINEVAFFLLTPPAVALHELAHAAVTWAHGGTIASFRFVLYWGAVLPVRIPPFSPVEHGLIALAGPLVTVMIGVAAAAWAVLRPRGPARNLLLIRFGELQLVFGLVFYPLISLPTGFGDFHLLRLDLNEAAPQAGNLVAGAWLAAAGAFLWYRSRPRWRRRVLEVTTGNYAELAEAEARLADDPGDVEALRRAANVHLSAEDAAGALPYLERLVAARPQDPFVLYTLAAAKSQDQRRRAEVLGHLEHARATAAGLPDTPEVTALRADIERSLRRLAPRGRSG